jgi:hypothetical protein
VANSSNVVGWSVENQSLLWVIAVLFYGVGDAVTTVIGVRMGNIEEVGSVALAAMELGGVLAFLGVKTAFIGACLLAWYLVVTPGRVAIPLALAVVGIGVTGWNLLMLAL